jgi:hypothetical protein
MVQILPLTHKQPAKMEREIGRMAVVWARLEWTITATVSGLVPTGPKESRLIFRYQSADQGMALIRDLTELHRIKLPTSFKTMTTHIKMGQQYRNAIIHGIWLRDKRNRKNLLQLTRGETSIPGKPKRFILPETEQPTPNDLRQFNNWIEDMLEKVQDLKVHLWANRTNK